MTADVRAVHRAADGRQQTASGSNYTARHLSVLEGLEAVRKRPGMYIGSTDSRGLMHCLWEIIDNSVDEALAGHCDHIEVILHADGSVEVRDNGRGIPVDVEPKTGLSGVEVVFTKLHAGGKFGGGSYAASGGLHGVGASVVNALSARLDVEVDRGGKTHAMSFRRGEPGTFADAAGPARTPRSRRSSTGPSCGSSARTKRGVTGTRVRYWADRQIFLKDAKFSYDELVTAGPADRLPGARPDARGPRRARPAGHAGRGRPARGDLPPRRRHRRVRRVPRHRHGRHRRLAAARARAPSRRPCRSSTTAGT